MFVDWYKRCARSSVSDIPTVDMWRLYPSYAAPNASAEPTGIPVYLNPDIFETLTGSFVRKTNYRVSVLPAVVLRALVL